MKANQKKELQGIKSQFINLMLDIWSTGRQESVLGLQAQFITNGILKTVVLGFLAFPETHTADNLRAKVEKHLQEEYDIILQEVQ